MFIEKNAVICKVVEPNATACLEKGLFLDALCPPYPIGRCVSLNSEFWGSCAPLSLIEDLRP